MSQTNKQNLKELKALNSLLDTKLDRLKYNKLAYFYPEDGKFARSKYPKMLDFFKAGAKYDQRLLCAANRSGKTYGEAGEFAMHATGIYPDWWEGRRFTKPISMLVVGVSNEETKNVLQKYLLGDRIDPGSGMIPKDRIHGKPLSKAGTPEGVELIRVEHSTEGVRDGVSTITFKTNEQGRETFQGTTYDYIWFDEEPDADVYEEALIRTATTEGLVVLTFTPLKGLSTVVNGFLKDGLILEGEHPDDETKYVVNMTWDDIPHLSGKKKKALLASTAPHLRDARSKGLPVLGVGAIYPIPEIEIMVDPFPIPDDWERSYGLDVGWNRTAAVWVARDPNTDIYYLYSEYYRGQAEPIVHAAGISARGKNLSGAVDPRSDSSNQVDGTRLLQLYIEHGLDLIPADNAVEAGVMKVYQMISTGQLKIFSTMMNWRSEYRRYQRKENGQINKKDDHLMDATRYWAMSGIDLLRPLHAEDEEEEFYAGPEAGGSETTGY